MGHCSDRYLNLNLINKTPTNWIQGWMKACQQLQYKALVLLQQIVPLESYPFHA